MNLLVPFGKIYGRVVDVRNRLYDRGAFRSYDLSALTISVGNLTTGGTGKTPLVALIAKLLIEKGETVCILTRGYGRVNPKGRVLVSDGEAVLVDAATGGDEPVELAHKLEGKTIIVADADRVAAAKWAREKFPITAFILDDGFQHRRARRDLDIVCIDATNPCGNGQILPAGTLRESFKGLDRADAIVITRTEQTDSVDDLENRLMERNLQARIFRTSTTIAGLQAIASFPGDSTVERQEAGSLMAFTGIGNPDNFFRSLEKRQFNVIATRSFPDHHRFTQDDMRSVEIAARKVGATAIVTTAKDAVKLNIFEFDLACYVAIAETKIENIEQFKSLLISSS